MRKVVVDTNLFIAAYFNRQSASAKIIELAKEGEIKLVWSDLLKKEMDLILGNVKASLKFLNRIQDILEKGIKVSPKEKLKIVKDDPEDNKLLECAQETEVDYILTNDHHLLEIGEFKSTKIIRPKEFLAFAF